MGRFAEGTTVDPFKTRAEIERCVRNHKAEQVGIATHDGGALVEFRANNRRVRFVVNFPKLADVKISNPWRNDAGKRREDAREAEIRRLWRALLLTIKSKFEVVESGIAAFEEEFLPHFVTADGRTVAEIIIPQIDAVSDGGSIAGLLPERT